MLFFYSKRAETRAEVFLSFGRKSKNRPTCRDFEKKNPDPQLHQIFKPIRKFFCIFYPKREKTRAKPEVWHEKSKTVLPASIFIFFFQIPNFTKF